MQKGKQARINTIIFGAVYAVGSISENQIIDPIGLLVTSVGGYLTGLFYNKTNMFTIVLSILVNFGIWIGDFIDETGGK